MSHLFVFHLLTAIILTALLLLKLPHVAEKIGLVDHPDDRKHHDGQIPLIGGIAMFIGFGFTLLTLDIPLNPYRGLFAGAMLLIVVGVLDDLHELSSTVRFLAQIIAAIAMAEWGGVRLLDLGQIGPDGGVLNLNWWSSLLTIFATVGAINSLNMIDGLDGLAGSITLVAVIALAAAALMAGDIQTLQVLLILLAVVMVFLFFNRPAVEGSKRHRIFMGDAGSMFLGFVLCWFFIRLSQGEARVIDPVTSLWIFAIPLIDTVSQMFRRLLKGESPFKPDRLHVHHLLLEKGYTAKQTVLILFSIASLLAALGLVAQYFDWSQMMMFYAFLGCFAAYFLSTYLHKPVEKPRSTAD
jgi:UDP-GlcNAc:undecaprenyl-phosphate GlcNAc-1-phosphate transferase